MRHRLRVTLYDEYRVDAELLDYLEGLPQPHKAELLSRFIRVGYQVLIDEAQIQEAYQEASLPTLKEDPIKTRSAKKADKPQAAQGIPAPLPKQPSVRPPATQDIEPVTFDDPVADIDQAAPEDRGSTITQSPAPASPKPSTIQHAPEAENGFGTLSDDLLDVDPAALADEEEVQNPPDPEPAGDAFSRMRKRVQEQK